MNGDYNMKQLFKVFTIIGLLIAGLQGNTQEIKKWKLADLEKTIQLEEKPTIINFWATFCKPCIEELPYFQEMAKKYEKEGVQLIMVSLDLKEAYPTAIKNFVIKRKINGNIVFLDETNADLFCPVVDPKWSGAIPASLFINNKKNYKAFFEDQLTKDQLEKEILKMIQ